MFVWLGSPLESLGYCYVVLHVLNLTDLPDNQTNSIRAEIKRKLEAK